MTLFSPQAQARLEAAGKSEALAPGDLAALALDMAAIRYPSTDPAPYRDHLASLSASIARQVKERSGDADADVPLGMRRDILHSVFVEQFGYSGDSETYDDQDNGNLYRVIDRQKGLPVVLGILVMDACRKAGWDAWGINFPGHFLIRLDGASGQRLILDPFHDLCEIQTHEMRDLLKAMAGLEAELIPQHYAALDDRDILLRLQNNAKVRHLRAGQLDRALEDLTIMCWLAPKQAALWREAGAYHATLEQFDEAVEALEVSLALETNDPQKLELTRMIQELRLRKSSP